MGERPFAKGVGKTSTLSFNCRSPKFKEDPMPDIVIHTPSTEAQKVGNQDMIVEAQAILVTDKESHESALGMMKLMSEMERGIANIFTDSKAAAHKAHKTICATEKELLSPLKECRLALGSRAATWEMAERRKAEEARRKAQEEADRKEREQKEKLSKAQEEADRKLAEAADAEKAGLMDEAGTLMDEAAGAEDKMEEILAAPMPEVTKPAPDVGKVAGVSVRTTWSAEVVDLEKFIGWVTQEVALRKHYLQPLQAELNQLARMHKEKLDIPGVKAVPKHSHGFRS